MMYNFNGFCGGAWGWWMMIFPIIFCGIIVYLILKPRHDDTISALRMKLANGEISEEEYNHRKQILNKR